MDNYKNLGFNEKLSAQDVMFHVPLENSERNAEQIRSAELVASGLNYRSKTVREKKNTSNIILLLKAALRNLPSAFLFFRTIHGERTHGNNKRRQLHLLPQLNHNHQEVTQCKTCQDKFREELPSNQTVYKTPIERFYSRLEQNRTRN